MQTGRIYDVKTFIDAVDYGVFMDCDGYGEGLRNGQVVDIYVLPSDVDVLSPQIEQVRWFDK